MILGKPPPPPIPQTRLSGWGVHNLEGAHSAPCPSTWSPCPRPGPLPVRGTTLCLELSSQVLSQGGPGWLLWGTHVISVPRRWPAMGTPKQHHRPGSWTVDIWPHGCEAGGPNPRCWQGGFNSPGLCWPPSHCPHAVPSLCQCRERERERRSSGASSYKDPPPGGSGPALTASVLNHALRGPTSTHSHVRVRASSYGFWKNS